MAGTRDVDSDTLGQDVCGITQAAPGDGGSRTHGHMGRPLPHVGWTSSPYQRYEALKPPART